MPQSLTTIGLVAQLDKPRVSETLHTLAQQLVDKGVKLRVEDDLSSEVPQAAVGDRTFVLEADAVITLGGDGTLLAVARQAAVVGTPVLGVDLGSFGFLADQPPDMVLANIHRLVSGDYVIERRMMLDGRVLDAHGGVTRSFLALNDVVVAKEVTRHLIWVRCEVDGHHMATYPADGIIVATATGSTAYSLSAGGPIVDPRVDCIVIVPICPHTLYNRPVVVNASSRVELRVQPRPARADPVAVAADGQESYPLQPDHTVVIEQADCAASFIRVGERSFFDRLRDKFNWDAPR